MAEARRPATLRELREAGPNLAALAGASLDDYGVPTLAGPFCFSALLFGLAAIVLMVLMRPDPAVLGAVLAHSQPKAPLLKNISERAPRCERSFHIRRRAWA